MGRQNRVLPFDCILLMLWRGPSGIGSFLTGIGLPTFALETISGSHLFFGIHNHSVPTTASVPGALGLISLPLKNCFVD